MLLSPLAALGAMPRGRRFQRRKFFTAALKNKLLNFLTKIKSLKLLKTETISVEEFRGKLIRHIPEKNFRMIRYYGIYANRVKNKLKEVLEYQVGCLFGETRLIFEPKNWRKRILELLGKDPLICPNCKTLMELKEIAYRAKEGTLKSIAIRNVVF